MLVLPVQVGEVTTITAPDGAQIEMMITNHHSNQQEPIVGFNIPPRYTVVRDRMKAYLATELDATRLYQISSSAGPQCTIAANDRNSAERHYRSLITSGNPFSAQLTTVALLPQQHSYPYALLAEHLITRMPRPFEIVGLRDDQHLAMTASPHTQDNID